MRLRVLKTRLTKGKPVKVNVFFPGEGKANCTQTSQFDKVGNPFKEECTGIKIRSVNPHIVFLMTQQESSEEVFPPINLYTVSRN